MDHLTPRKIQKLLTLAEDKTYTDRERRLLCDPEDLDRIVAEALKERRTPYCESSSGIFDLDQLPGFDEAAYLSSSLCNTFNTVEITGRSTDADCTESQPFKIPANPVFGESKRKSLMSVLEAQSSDLPDLMRHSVAVDMSFHSRRDLTADEASLIAREVGAQPSRQEGSFGLSENNAFSVSRDMSVGAYFERRCAELGKVLNNGQSPDRSYMMPSITEVSQHRTYELGKDQTIDDTLDSIPVRQTQQESDTESKCAQAQGAFKVPNQPVGESSKSAKNGTGLSKLPVSMKAGVRASHKPLPGPPSKCLDARKPADVLLKNLQASYKQISEDTGDENSLSLSKIADYLGKQSEVSVTDMLQLNKTQNSTKSQPLSELNMNIQTSDEAPLTLLKDTRKAETASSAGTMETVMCMDKLKISSVPQVVVTGPNDSEEVIDDDKSTRRATKSKSPSSRSQSTASTVRDNLSNSPLQSSRNLGEGNRSKIPSPNREYKELDKSVDWQDVLHQKRLKRETFTKEQWAEIVADPVEGYVGVICAVTIKVTTMTDSWLTARIQFDQLPNNGKDLNIELPRLPLLLSPGKSEQFIFYFTSNVELNTSIPFTVFLKDTCIEGEMPQKGNLKVNFKLPVIQAMSSTGVNKVSFPPILEKRSQMKCFVLLSESPVDLQLELRIVEGESVFNIRNVQEVKKSDVNKILLEPSGGGQALGKSKSINRQLCRLTKGNAIKVAVVFNAPRMDSMRMEQDQIIKGILNVNLLGVNSLLRRVELTGVIGFTKLELHTSEEKVHVPEETGSVSITNSGSIAGLWRVKTENSAPFTTQPETFELSPGAISSIKLIYTGPEDCVNEGTIVFEEIATGKKTKLQVSGGVDKPKHSYFPIKTNHHSMSWVRAGVKEISLLNCSDNKVQLRCKIKGDAFSVETSKPGVDTKIIGLTFGPQERRNVPIIFNPNTNKPYAAVLLLSNDRNSEYCRKVTLYGCESGGRLRWSGLATYGNTALVRAVVHSPIELKLFNKSSVPAFVCARLQFNLHYLSVSSGSHMVGDRAIIGGRSSHRIVVRVDWARVEKRARHAPPAAAASLATLTLLTGAEITRRRILKIIRDEAGNLDKSLLPENLRSIVEAFDGEDLTMDHMLNDFHEPKASLEEVIDGLEELTAQIDLPIDFADENDTILIADETIVAYHTLCD